MFASQVIITHSEDSRLSVILGQQRKDVEPTVRADNAIKSNPLQRPVA